MDMSNKFTLKVIEAKQTMLSDNDKDADRLREELAGKHTFFINIMSSPGSGKTSVLLATIERLKNDFRIGVMEADIDSVVDAMTIAASGTRTIQIHTGDMYHLDAQMSRQGLRELGIDDLNVVFLENVGNLVYPAEFDTGAALNLAILSVPEGDDKPLKYPLIFEKADVVLINKTDTLPFFDFDMEHFEENLRSHNKKAPFFAVSAKTGEGMESWCEWLKQCVQDFINGK